MHIYLHWHSFIYLYLSVSRYELTILKYTVSPGVSMAKFLSRTFKRKMSGHLQSNEGKMFYMNTNGILF